MGFIPNFHWMISHFVIKANVDFELGVFWSHLNQKVSDSEIQNQNIDIWQIHKLSKSYQNST